MDGSKVGRPGTGRVLVWIAYAAAAAIGAYWGYDFGVKIGGGMVLGIAAALNAAAFGMLAVAGVAQWLVRRPASDPSSRRA